MKALPILAALAVLAAIARLARELRDVQPATVSQSAADASDVVGMPTFLGRITGLEYDLTDVKQARLALMTYDATINDVRRAAGEVPMTWSVPPGYFIELAPTSRN